MIAETLDASRTDVMRPHILHAAKHYPPTGGGMGSMDAIGTVRLGVNLEERENRVTVTMGPGTLVALDSITVQHGAPA